MNIENMQDTNIGRKITIIQLFDKIDNTDNDKLKSQIQWIYDNDEIEYVVAFYDKDENIVASQIWTKDSTYITHQHPLMGLILTRGLRYPPTHDQIEGLTMRYEESTDIAKV